MPERVSHGETLQAGAPLRIGDLLLVPIERVVRNVDFGELGLWFTFDKEPYALVVRDASGTRALEVAAATVSIEELRERIPGFDALLAAG